jgi:hypothetical protein
MEKEAGRNEKNHEYGKKKSNQIQQPHVDSAKEEVRICGKSQKPEYSKHPDHSDHFYESEVGC